ncbi:MAG: ankyrin repeat domain-containing protein [Roseburia sp.]|nr:ankyrin repeat domain-containing protein [Roseburia sp.]MCM1279612.1 ankyrin repeat domain-containing protein [Robinsoniella sp.]
MAFAGMFLMFLTVVIIILVICVFSAIILFIVSFLMKKRYKKNLSENPAAAENAKKYYLVPKIVGWVFLIPIFLLVGLIAFAYISTSISHHNSLGYQVMHGNYSRAEQIMKKGVSPDCTLESNEPAKPGEQTLLSLLCEKGFVNTFEESIDEEETEEELKMIQLLIDYGADLESRTYQHNLSYSDHFYHDEPDLYACSDMCGYTPFLYAVYMGNEKTVKLLVENGADIHVEDYCGFNAILTIADNLNDSNGLSLLQYLLEKGCDQNHYTHYYQEANFLSSRHYSSDSEPLNKKMQELFEEIVDFSSFYK